MLGKVEKKKMEMVSISSDAFDEFYKVMGEICNDRYGQLEGRLLTTLEILLPDGNSLKALKERVRGVQGETWANIHQEYSRSVSNYFIDIRDKDSNSIEADVETRKAHIEHFIEKVRYLIRENLKYYSNVVIGLVGIAIGNSEKFPFAKKEIDRLIQNTRAKMVSYTRKSLSSVLGNYPFFK